MNTGNFPLLSFDNAQLEWDENNKPRSTLYGDIYFSAADAIGESEYVFLEKNNLKQRWLDLANAQFIIAECGFGSALNFLTSCKLWCESSADTARLHYIACEKHPLLKSDLERLHNQWPQLKVFSQELLQHYPEHTAGIHRLHLRFDKREITLDLLYGDACSSLSSIYQSSGFIVDAWFLDGFSPKLNPEMWSSELLNIISCLSKPGTTLSTYSVAGQFRRGLISVGFKVTKETGFANKRHMLSATLDFSLAKQSNLFPWFSLPQQPKHQQKTVTIVGAGLAGCSTAYAMANKGWQVTLIERSEQVAAMASGNPQGIVHFKLHKKQSPLTKLAQQAYLYAIRQYQILAQQTDLDWHQCGMLQLAYNAEEEAKQKKLVQEKLYSSKIFHALSSEESSSVADIPLTLGGLFFPESGWINPKALCQAYLQHPAITVRLETAVIALKKVNDQWQTIITGVEGKDEIFTRSDALVIANSVDAAKFNLSKHYPLIPNRGQVDFVESNDETKKLHTVLCTNAYITPASKGKHSLGGHFVPNTLESAVKKEDAEENHKLLQNSLPYFAKQFDHQKNYISRAAIRCSTPDYLPIVGPVECYQDCKIIYKELSLNARKKIENTPSYAAGLFVNIAHGSHGLTNTPLAAEYLAALLNREPLPIQNEVINCLHPLRFLLRDLKKQKA